MTTDADESAFVNVTVKPNFATLRQRCPGKIKQIAPALKSWGHDEVTQLEAGKTIVVADEPLTLADVLLERKPPATRRSPPMANITVVLDTALTRNSSAKAWPTT